MAPSIIVPGPLAQLAASPDDLRRVEARIVSVVEQSFREDARRAGRAPTATQAEIRRRTQICTKWFRVFRAEFQVSVVRALDSLGTALRAELDGLAFDRGDPTVSTWAVPDSDRSGTVDLRHGEDLTKLAQERA